MLNSGVIANFLNDIATQKLSLLERDWRAEITNEKKIASVQCVLLYPERKRDSLKSSYLLKIMTSVIFLKAKFMHFHVL